MRNYQFSFPTLVQGMFFPPQLGGKRQNEEDFPPKSQTLGGEISGFFPSKSGTLGGEISAVSPPIGGETEKILRNRASRLSIFLNEIAFPASKLSKFSPAAR